MRSDREELPEGFTKEEADLAEIREYELQQRQSAVARGPAPGPGCQQYWPSDKWVCSAIRDKYNSLGAQFSFLLWPTSDELTSPDGHGKFNTFQNGPIYWSAAGGAHPVVNSILNRWGVHQYEMGWLGYPTTDEIVHADGIGRRQEFQGGAIYVSLPNAIGSAVGGAIRDKWNTVGAETPGSLLGYPLSDEIVLPDGQGRMNRFERGVIYWSPTTGAHPVTGGILEVWASRAYEAGTHGYPTSDEYDADGGRRQNFQNGSIDWNPNWDMTVIPGQPPTTPPSGPQSRQTVDNVSCTMWARQPYLYHAPGATFDHVEAVGGAYCIGVPDIWNITVKLWEDVSGNGHYDLLDTYTSSVPPSLQSEEYTAEIAGCNPNAWYHTEVHAEGFHGNWDEDTINSDDYQLC
ncbi:LGFP repeat-containing protein [Rhodococcus erythropolis]|uniref:LGFP repeat-containing protein n=1 Tax=Rhodococcus erythropolis TaxID=1833 RepID=UPI002225EDAF|nr:hypothetical protein [Rhodococcus erythropolis]MCW2295295.1 uncharacterized protein with LGFP repeats [Rhodococcus erythropolis]